MQIPYQELGADVLQGIIEEFVLREGTEYGSSEYSLEQKTEQVMAQLRSGKVVIVYDETEETCNIVPASEVKRSES